MRNFFKRCMAYLLIFVQLLVFFTPIIYTEEAEPTEEIVDFSEEKYQEYAWLVFQCTDWNNNVNLNFSLGNEGIAFGGDVDNYEDFVNVFEDKLIVTLKALDAKEASGVSLGVKHTYKWIEYEKIIACILYSMLIKDKNAAFNGGVFTFYDTEASVSALEITKDLILYMDDNQKEMAEAATDFYIYDSLKESLINDLGYTEENYKNVIWKELGKMYFGVTYIDTFDEFIIRLVKEITREDGTTISIHNGEASGDFVYIFDPYASKESITGCLNFILLDSLALKFQIKNTDNYKDSLFQKVISHENFNSILEEYLSLVRGEGSFGITFDWISYSNVVTDIVKDREDGSKSYIYSFDYADTKGLGNIYDGYFHYFVDDSWASVLPGSGDSSSNSFGWFWYDNYTSSRIVKHTINGVTGELVDN